MPYRLAAHNGDFAGDPLAHTYGLTAAMPAGDILGDYGFDNARAGDR